MRITSQALYYNCRLSDDSESHQDGGRYRHTQGMIYIGEQVVRVYASRYDRGDGTTGANGVSFETRLGGRDWRHERNPACFHHAHLSRMAKAFLAEVLKAARARGGGA